MKTDHQSMTVSEALERVLTLLARLSAPTAETVRLSFEDVALVRAALKIVARWLAA